jgi:hypothetical protein
VAFLQSYLITDDEGPLHYKQNQCAQDIKYSVILVWAQRKNRRTHITQITNPQPSTGRSESQSQNMTLKNESIRMGLE